MGHSSQEPQILPTYNAVATMRALLVRTVERWAHICECGDPQPPPRDVCIEVPQVGIAALLPVPHLSSSCLLADGGLYSRTPGAPFLQHCRLVVQSPGVSLHVFGIDWLWMVKRK